MKSNHINKFLSEFSVILKKMTDRSFWSPIRTVMRPIALHIFLKDDERIVLLSNSINSKKIYRDILICKRVVKYRAFKHIFHFLGFISKYKKMCEPMECYGEKFKLIFSDLKTSFKTLEITKEGKMTVQLLGEKHRLPIELKTILEEPKTNLLGSAGLRIA